MNIDIVVPKGYSQRKLLKQTRDYFNNTNNDTKNKFVFEGKDQGYYVLVKHKSLQIEVVDDCEQNSLEIKKFLEHLFADNYIGVTVVGKENFQLELDNVKCFNI